VEHDPEDLWETVVRTMRTAVKNARISVRELVGIGITNQRETALIWDRANGQRENGSQVSPTSSTANRSR
jgi:glycerol kinase